MTARIVYLDKIRKQRKRKRLPPPPPPSLASLSPLQPPSRTRLLIAIETARRAALRGEGNVNIVRSIAADPIVDGMLRDLLVAETTTRLRRVTQGDIEQFDTDRMRRLCADEAWMHVLLKVLVPAINEVLGEERAVCVTQFDLFGDAGAAP